MFIGLLSATSNSYTPHPKVKLLEFVYDVKSWLSPHIEDLHGHTQPHCFKFVLNSDGYSEMYYKNWSHDVWSENGLILLKVCLNMSPSHIIPFTFTLHLDSLYQSVLFGVPHVLTPDFGKLDIPKLKQDIPKFSPWMTSESTEEWSSFLRSGFAALVDAATETKAKRSWMLDDLPGFRHEPQSNIITTEMPIDNYECTV